MYNSSYYRNPRNTEDSIIVSANKQHSKALPCPDYGACPSRPGPLRHCQDDSCQSTFHISFPTVLYGFRSAVFLDISHKLFLYRTALMMSGEAWLYLLAVLINAVNLFLQVFFTIMYSDLEWYIASLTYKTTLKTS